MEGHEHQAVPVHKGRKTALGLLLAFVLPLLAAQLVLRMGWYQGGATNYGELMTNEVMLPIREGRTWALVLPTQEGSACQQSCARAHYLMTQTYTALGREQSRVELFEWPARKRLQALSLSNSMPLNEPMFSAATQAKSPDQGVNTHSDASIYIADPLGRLVLRYTVPGDKEGMLATGKGLLRDLKRLLKQSKIG